MNKIKLVTFLFLICSCSTHKHLNLDTKILRRENLSTKKYYVNKIVLIHENESSLIGYNCRVINGLIPYFIDGEKFKLVLKIDDKIFFLNDDEIKNIKLLNQFRSTLTNDKLKEKIDTFFNDYKRGYILTK